MIKLIVSDLDGTLLDSNSKLNSEFFDVYNILKEKGVKFVIATGRGYKFVRETFEKIQSDVYFIVNNGALLIKNDDLIDSIEMENSSIKKIQEYVIEKNLELKNKPIGLIVTGILDSAMIEGSEEIYRKLNYWHPEIYKLDNMDNFREILYQGGIYNHDENYDTNLIALELEEKFKEFNIKISGPMWIDILNKKTNKGYMVEKLQKKYNISKDETLIFGDYNNDIVMLKLASLSYAMENACEDVKKVAKYRCPSNNDNGVIKTIRELIEKGEI